MSKSPAKSEVLAVVFCQPGGLRRLILEIGTTHGFGPFGSTLKSRATERNCNDSEEGWIPPPVNIRLGFCPAYSLAWQSVRPGELASDSTGCRDRPPGAKDSQVSDYASGCFKAVSL